MRRRAVTKAGLAPLSALLWASQTALAHHGFGTFAMNEDIEITGTVKDLAFVNPHSWLYLEVVEDDGSVVDFRCEMRSANTLRRSGWTPDLFPIGGQVTITGSPDRHDPYSCYVSTLIFPDGSSLDRYGQRSLPPTADTEERPLRLANGDPNISGDWAQEQRVMTDPRGQLGTLVPLSQADDFGLGGVPEGQRAIPGARGTPEAEQDFDGGRRRSELPAPTGLTEAGLAAYEALDFGDRYRRSCLFTSIIADWGGEPINRITQREDSILLQYGRLGVERTIHMNSRQHPADIAPSRVGHSMGRWDGDVLFVDTVGFEPGILVGRIPHSSELHVLEEFSYEPAARQLIRRYTAEDPPYRTEPLAGMDVLDVSSVPYSPERCEDRTLDDDAALGPRE